MTHSNPRRPLYFNLTNTSSDTSVASTCQRQEKTTQEAIDAYTRSQSVYRELIGWLSNFDCLSKQCACPDGGTYSYAYLDFYGYNYGYNYYYSNCKIRDFTVSGSVGVEVNGHTKKASWDAYYEIIGECVNLDDSGNESNCIGSQKATCASLPLYSTYKDQGALCVEVWDGFEIP